MLSGITSKQISQRSNPLSAAIRGKMVLTMWVSILSTIFMLVERLCGIVVRVPGYRSRGAGFDSGATRFSEK
jgi:hypothetical protein